MEAIEQEINDKLIEKGQNITQEITELENATIVEKKPRSEAQKKAFAKARAKRMENLKNKEEDKNKALPASFESAGEGDGITTTPVPAPAPAQKKKRGRPKGARNKKVIKHQEPPPTPDRPYYPHPVEHPIPQAQPPQYQFQGQHYPPQHYYPPPPPPQAPVNNYYYYGGAPPAVEVANEEPEYAVLDSEDEVIEPEPPATTNPEFEYQEAPVEATLRYRFV